MFKKIILITLICIGCSCIANANPDNSAISLSKVPFKLISEDNFNPIVNRKIIVYNGDIKIDYAPDYNPYPYDDTGKNEPWFITIIQTDNEGKFYLNHSRIKSTDIILQLGEPYQLIHFEKSSDISHTKSNYHIRIVRFKKGETKVLRNDIYDLKNKILKEISLDGNVETKPFEEIILIVQRKK